MRRLYLKIIALEFPQFVTFIKRSRQLQWVEIHIRAVITLIVFFFLSSLFSSSVLKVDDERCASEAIGFYLNPRSDLSRRFRQLFVSWEVFFPSSLVFVSLIASTAQLSSILQPSKHCFSDGGICTYILKIKMH